MVDRRLADPAPLPALLAIATGLLLALADAGFGAQQSAPAALFLLAVLALIGAIDGPATRAYPRPLCWALTALVAFALWALVSATWSDVPAIAWEGANRVLLYAIVLAIVAAHPWRVGGFMVALGLMSAGLALIALGVLATGALGGDPASLFIEGRLSAPAGYANGAAALWLLGVWPALALACGPGAPWALRAGALGVACLLLEMSLLSVSRGAVAALVFTALVFVAISTQRHRVVAALAVVTGCTLLAARPLLAVSDATSAAGLGHAFDTARMAIVLTTALAVALSAAGILVGRRARSRIGPAQGLTWWRAGTRATLAAALIGAALIVAVGSPLDWIDDRWQDFKSSGYSQVATGSDRITGSLGSGRYDYYRVALNEFADHPMRGIGYENFQVPYLIHRRTDEAPRYAHSLVFGVLSQTGVVGGTLLLAFLTAALTAAAQALRAAGERRTLAAGALAGFTAWFAHAQVDWLWELPGLGILAFAMLGLAARGCAATVIAPVPARFPRVASRTVRRVGGALAVLAVLAVGASFATLGLAARHARDALDEAPRDAARAFALLGRAAQFDPLAAGPLLTRGLLAQRLGDRRAAERAFVEALGREPRNWFAELELAALRAGAGQRGPALQALARAERLNPRQPVIDKLGRTISSGAPIVPAELERALYAQERRRVRALP